MLKVLRENVKYLSWILWVVIALFILAIFVDFGAGMRSPASPTASAAKVGGDTITRDDFDRTYRMLGQRYKQQYGEQMTDQMLKQLQLPLKALNQAVNDTILLAEARRAGFKASDEEVREQILQYFKDDQGRFIGQDRYAEALQRLQYTIPAFEDEIRREILMRKLEDSLLATIYVGDQEVEKSYREQVERAKIRYLALPRSRFAQAAEVPQAEVAAYYQAHRQEYKLPERRDVAYLLVEPFKLRNQVKVDDAEVKAYYDQHLSEFTQQEQVRARQILLLVNDKRTDAEAQRQLGAIRQRIEKGEEFGAIARQVSEDTGSKPNGGDMGYFTRGRNIKEFEDAAFAAQPGKLVGPIKSPIGYHLLEVTDRRPGGPRLLAEVREQIRMQLTSQKSQQLAEEKARDLAKVVAAGKPKDATAFTALGKSAAGVTAGDSGKFGQQEPVPGIGISQPFSGAAFALKNKGDVSEPVQVPRGWAILYLEAIEPPHLAELSEVEPKVRQALAVLKQQQVAMDKLSQARKELGQGKTLDQVAAELGVTAQETPEFGGQGQIPGLGYSPQIAGAALALPPGQIGGPLPYAQGALLFQVTDRKVWDPAKFAAVRAETRSTLQQQRFNQLIGSLVEQRRRELGVTFNQRLLDSFGTTDKGTPQG
jgi:peptidyl-prolyl cis-trans isomerase D